MNILAVVSPDLQSKAQMWAYAIAVLTPLIIQLSKKVVPAIPKWALPSVSPFIGILLGFGLNAVTATNLTWVDGALLGGFGVTIREIFDQAITKRMSKDSAS